jgi:DNA-binding SARP family transcriptional activator
VIELHVLGPVEASAHGRSLALGGAKTRAVLAMLALEDRMVSVDHLIEGLWGEHPPASAAKMVQTYVWRLRTALGEDSGAQIVTRGRGYELRVDPDHVDVRRFERLVTSAGRAERAGVPGGAAREALALWRGPPLADVAGEPFAPAAIRRLEELRVEAAELAIAADLAAGRQQEVASEIETLIAEHPLRERLHAQRMLALYRCGRQAAALEAFRRARRTLVDEVGVEPGPELRALHEAILRQDSSLDLVAVPELPRELDPAGASPLAGRDLELACLRSLWQHARSGAGTLLALAGEPGVGKTRLAAELAAEAHREGGTVLYAAGTGPPAPALAAIAAAERAPGPVLLIADDADRAPGAVAGALDRLAGRLEGVATLVVATGRDRAALERLPADEVRVLDPLDRAAVRQIAVLHAPAGAAADLPVDALLETAGGVARRVHEAAAAWGRQEAARRVDAVARRAAAGHTQARALEAELAGRVVELQATRERAGLLAGDPGAAGGPPACPYKGLRPSTSGDADLLLRARAPRRRRRRAARRGAAARRRRPVRQRQVLPLRAGAAARARRGGPAGQRGVGAGADASGRAPAARAVRGARAAAPARPRVLVVDQFEEVFTTCPDERERAQFVAELVAAATGAEGRSSSSRCGPTSTAAAGAYPELSAALGAGPRAARPHDSGRAAPGDRASRGAGWPAARAGVGRAAARRLRGRVRSAAAALHGAGRVVAGA